MSFFDLGDTRGHVRKIREQEAKKTARFHSEERKRKMREKALAAKTRELRTESAYYEAKAEKRAARRDASLFGGLPTFKVKKKKQGRKLSRKSRIRLI